MKNQRLGLYRIDIKYVRNLANVDGRVMSVSPQEGKSSRPFVGVILICDEYKYCIPMSSPKPKHAAMKNDNVNWGRFFFYIFNVKKEPSPIYTCSAGGRSSSKARRGAVSWGT